MTAAIEQLSSGTDRSARDQMCDYIRAQLLGPSGGPTELITSPAKERYLLGTLYPQDADIDQFLSEDEIQNISAETGLSADDLSEERSDQPVAVSNDWLPSSLGLSFFTDATSIRCLCWGSSYVSEGKSWRRVPMAEFQAPEEIELTLPSIGSGATKTVSALTGKAMVSALWRPFKSGFIVTVTLMNTAKLPSATSQSGKQNQKRQSESCLHQVGFRCAPKHGHILEYPTVDAVGRDEEAEELRLIYREARVFAVGHGCSVAWPRSANGTAAHVQTEYLPEYDVPALTYSIGGEEELLVIRNLVDFDIDRLTQGLKCFVDLYADWIQRLKIEAVPAGLDGAKHRIVERLEQVLYRLYRGVNLLATDSLVERAFRLANRAMLEQMHRSRVVIAGKSHARNTRTIPSCDYRQLEYKWRPFQLAFQILTLESTANEDSVDRENVDLIWFPTGGGKTEAYLAVAAFAIFLRRLRYGDAASGTAVITRYTLSLLTAQQFQRAATLICACERLRATYNGELGKKPITIGLWIGDRHTPNRVAKAHEKAQLLYEDDNPVSFFQIQQCAWCGTALLPTERTADRAAYGFRSDGLSFRLFCPSDDCDFNSVLPIQVIDEELYKAPPTFLLATVDKFAMLAWEDRSTAFFGSAESRPPSLIIQDELHLLSGPLGTTVGLYEMAVESLIRLRDSKPKIIASTATIRRANDQVCGLFGRPSCVFPASGLYVNDSYFAKVDPSAPGRRYLGVMPQSKSTQTSMVDTASSILQGINECDLDDEARDAYWTLVIYHNSLRELGRTITLARADIPERLEARASDPERVRVIEDENVMELRSNVGGDKLPKLLQRLYETYGSELCASIVACTNMFSVGVDVPRLGVMLMNGQPKSTSEYIQSTSRVGRGSHPGLVVALYGATRPRDRSHYEQFVSYHSALYRHVEPTSVTPLSPPSRARALHAVLVILARHWIGLLRDDAAGEFRKGDPSVAKIREVLLERVMETDAFEAEATTRHFDRLCDEWDQLAVEASSKHKPLFYRSAGKSHTNLLKPFGSKGPGWATLTSMRNVDTSCGISIVGEDHG
jgi:hypothetical protein